MTPVTPHAASTAARVSDFADSEMFRRLFRDGMDLVEETASYLDGPGRDDARRLGRSGALAYASESMGLTTQLMQCASWLLTQRAVAEGDMNADEAAEERYRLSPNKFSPPSWPAGDDPCPPRLGDLALRARELHERLMRLDDSLFEAEQKLADNPVANQLSQLSAAFSDS
ncbi:protease adaptor protein RcdA [Oceanicaulis sp.]|uniref:protease adaptor protein RcdA n=1 Tax=Oceanicaulis sp. TaxID=1924941 RepID=UPI003F708D0F